MQNSGIPRWFPGPPFDTIRPRQQVGEVGRHKQELAGFPRTTSEINPGRN
jgi:hypothetical protein